MTEKLLQYIWQFQYFNRSYLITAEGENIQVVHPGQHNKNQGPDFINARIRIGSALLAGSIELHTKASEWAKHRHQHDQNYDNVILHVVYKNDIELENGIPVLELKSRISNLMLDRYEALMNSADFISCAPSIAAIKDITLLSWKERLLAERLSRKAQKVFVLLERSNNHWEETFWQLLARSFGTNINADAFEALAQSIPVKILARHKNSIQQLEALLFGQANFLEEEFEEEYPRLLQREYRFLKNKYALAKTDIPFFFLRMRPGNFPTLRLAQLAMLVHSSSHLFSKILEEQEVRAVKKWLGVTANDFWHYHYSFRQTTAFKPKHLGTAMINNILINTIVPALFAYGLYHNNEKIKTKALQWLEKTGAEANTILSGFNRLGILNKSAYDSQALLELKNEYCTKKRCLECSVGNYLLKT